MPLILLCGFPCSGKTLVAERLTEALREKRPQCEVVVVSEEAVARESRLAVGEEEEEKGDPRATIFANYNLEKQLRMQIKSQTERQLARTKGRTSVVILVDASNYIKGYRYEMYCLAKLHRQQQAVIHCTTPEDTCLANNTKSGRYPEKVFASLINRFERPDDSARWDNPLYRISLPDPEGALSPEEDLTEAIENLSSCIINDLLTSNVKVKPNKTTLANKSASADYIQMIERATNAVIDLVLTAQSRGDERMTLPNQDDVVLELANHIAWTPTTLTKAKRNFISFVQSGFGSSNVSEGVKRANEAELTALFVRFLSNETQRSSFLA